MAQSGPWSRIVTKLPIRPQCPNVSIRNFSACPRHRADKPVGSKQSAPQRTAPTSSTHRTRNQTRAPRPGRTQHDTVANMLKMQNQAERKAEEDARAEAESIRKDMESFMGRKWNMGEVYSPKDLGDVEMSKWRSVRPRGRPDKDIFDMLRVNPLKHYLNFAMMSEFVTSMGRIQHSKITGLRAINQRRLSKAVKRAQGLGLMPRMYKHPEILRQAEEKRR